MMSVMLGQRERQNELYYCGLLLTIALGWGVKAGFTMDRGWKVWLPPPPAVKILVRVSCWVVLPAWQDHLHREVMKRLHLEVFIGETCSLVLKNNHPYHPEVIAVSQDFRFVYCQAGYMTEWSLGLGTCNWMKSIRTYHWPGFISPCYSSYHVLSSSCYRLVYCRVS